MRIPSRLSRMQAALKYPRSGFIDFEFNREAVAGASLGCQSQGMREDRFEKSRSDDRCWARGRTPVVPSGLSLLGVLLHLGLASQASTCRPYRD